MVDELSLFMSYGETVTVKQATFSLLMAFALSQMVGMAYIWTFRGMSYTRSFVHAVTLGSMVAAMLMLAINNSIAAGLGIAGSLAIIRFRTAMRDPRDMVFVFAGLGAGIACGLRAYSAAVSGTLLFCLASLVLTWTEFGAQRIYDGLLRFQAPATAETEQEVAKALRRCTKRFALVTLREVAQGEAMEHAYQIRFDETGRRRALLSALEGVPGVQDVSLMLQEPTVEL
jgi:uncharacterized membrane protein YhiD involved in acid resistance